MGLVDDDSTGVRQDGTSARPSVDSVCQQEVVVADLEGKAALGAVLQEGEVAAIWGPRKAAVWLCGERSRSGMSELLP